MKPLTREWVSKAEGDYATARRELLARRQPNHDAACFHAQQCVEKYLKLTAYAVETRYPGKSSDRSLARDAFAQCREIRSALRKVLRLRQ